MLSYKALVCQSNELGLTQTRTEGGESSQTSAQRAALYLHRHNEEAVAKQANQVKLDLYMGL